MTPSELNEEQLVEKPAHRTFEELGYETLYGPELHPGMEKEERTLHEVLLLERLRTKLEELNPDLPSNVYDIAIRQIQGLSQPSLIENNREFHHMLLAGVKVPYTKDGKTQYFALKLIDYKNTKNNDFLAIRQFHVKQHEYRKIDHAIFINGIPLILFEYKDPTNKNATIVDAYHQLGKTKYQSEIPRIFYYNVFLVISDRTYARFGTLTAPFERFSDWNDPEQPDREVENRLELMQHLMFEKSTLLNIIKNFIEYESDGKTTIKKICQQHQYLAVNTAIQKSKEVFPQKDENRIGVVWHTTGSGKSLTMIYYVNMLSKLKEFENPTFVLITDRRDLDEQLNYFFKVAGFPYSKPPTAIQEAESIVDLREKLESSEGKIIFTTIQKFQITKEERDGKVKYPKISDRRNIIIIADEAHRSQYLKMAQNLEKALPNALKIGFTGTPIEYEDRSTRHVFGETISEYKIPDAVRDGATVQISSYSRLVKLHLLNKFIGKDYEELTQDLDEDTSERLAKKWSELKRLVEDPDRVGTIAKDVVFHFNERQKVFKGKAMLAATTKLAAARYADIISKLPNAPKCTCIISGTKMKPEKLQELPEAKRRVEEVLQNHYKDKKEINDLIGKFKDENDELSLLIVCDMYLTGFDAPVTHTMYIDKPLRNHNLIQAISRVNRVWKDKPGGTIIDYIGIADDLKRAFGAYSQDDVKGAMVPTDEIISYMNKKHEELINFFSAPIAERTPQTDEVKLIYDAIDEIVHDDEVKKKFFDNVTQLTKAYAVCTPHPVCQEVEDDLRLFQKMRKIMSKATAGAPKDLSDKESAIQDLVEKGIGADQVIKSFHIEYTQEKIDLNQEYIQKIKKIPQKNLKVELAFKLLDDAIQGKFRRNIVKRKSFQERIEKTLNKYHERFWNDDDTIAEFESIGKDFTHESTREQELGLTDDEIAFYDIVVKGKEYVESDKELRDVASDVTKYMKNKTETIDWNNQDQVKAEIRNGVRVILRRAKIPFEEIDKLMPEIMELAENNYGQME
ncbi:Putative type-1 restriction enzyme MjaXP R protein [Marine Group I thaumarchaeote SCGC AAA799-N04]|uniref:type I site-specific deoxyribonuclease n=1 Tax=Marine Group I thaumarchaeote SCGC AAA799-N04 TaxID=1502293 RepID=A0A081RMH1_9ARCH|nr:Putative type-1 restriction enzyme MjaXP R protein [Marine Group I thaumarchaeote SCGC AAA799-N04]